MADYAPVQAAVVVVRVRSEYMTCNTGCVPVAVGVGSNTIALCFGEFLVFKNFWPKSLLVLVGTVGWYGTGDSPCNVVFT